jgi:hypothetical protein
MARIDPPEEAAEGARLLRKFLDARRLSIPKFADAHGVNRLVLQKLMNGAVKRVSVDVAYAIERATDGGVPMESWRARDAGSAAKAA